MPSKQLISRHEILMDLQGNTCTLIYQHTQDIPKSKHERTSFINRWIRDSPGMSKGYVRIFFEGIVPTSKCKVKEISITTATSEPLETSLPRVHKSIRCKWFRSQTMGPPEYSNFGPKDMGTKTVALS